MWFVDNREQQELAQWRMDKQIKFVLSARLQVIEGAHSINHLLAAKHFAR